jgi:hypothetical protein
MFETNTFYCSKLHEINEKANNQLFSFALNSLFQNYEYLILFYPIIRDTNPFHRFE